MRLGRRSRRGALLGALALSCACESSLTVKMPPRPDGTEGVLIGAELDERLEVRAVALSAEEKIAIEVPANGHVFVHYVGRLDSLGLTPGPLVEADPDACVARSLPSDGLFALDAENGDVELRVATAGDAEAWAGFRYLAPCPCARFEATTMPIPGKQIYGTTVRGDRVLVATNEAFVEVDPSGTVERLGPTENRVRAIHAGADGVFVGLRPGAVARVAPAVGVASLEILATVTSTHVGRMKGPKDGPVDELYWFDADGNLSITAPAAGATTRLRDTPYVSGNHGSSLLWLGPRRVVFSQESGEGIIDYEEGRFTVYDWSFLQGDIKFLFPGPRGPMVATGFHELWERDPDRTWHKYEEALAPTQVATVVGVAIEPDGFLALRSNGLFSQWIDDLARNCQPLFQLDPSVAYVAMHRVGGGVIAVGHPRDGAGTESLAVFVQRLPPGL